MGKATFFTGQPIFTQLLSFIPRPLIGRLCKKYAANRYYKTFLAYDHLVCMLYQGFFQCLSLRELTTGLQANAQRLLHLGLINTPRRSTLADANKKRTEAFFGGLYKELYKLHYPDSPQSYKDRLFIIDSTTCSLFSNIMQGAGSPKKDGRKKGGVKAHLLVDSAHNLPSFVTITEGKEHDLTFLKDAPVPDNCFLVFDKAYTNYTKFNQWNGRGITWVTRQKNDAHIQLIRMHSLSSQSAELGVMEDAEVLMGRPSNQHVTPLVKARRIVFEDPQTKRVLVFITNNFELAPQAIADIYKRRWQIELLFKRIKQRYPLRYFLGETANAIKIQIWAMLICDLLTQLVMKVLKQRKARQWSYANLSGMIKHHLMTYINLIIFLTNPEKALQNYKPPGDKHLQQGALF
jgi:transposase